jgi:hypothetical protein
MDPINYLEIHKEEIIEDCENARTKFNGESLIVELKSFIKELIPIRISKRKTIERCRELTSRYEMIGNHLIAIATNEDLATKNAKKEFDIDIFTFTKWSISALKEDDSFTYSYNALVQFFNRNSGLLTIAIKTDVDVSAILKSNKKTKTLPASVSYYFFDKVKAKKLMPFLIERYKDAKPAEIALMIFALINLRMIDYTICENQTQLHSILLKEFGKIGSRSSLQGNISRFNNTQYSEDKIKIKTHSDLINNYWLKTGSQK